MKTTNSERKTPDGPQADWLEIVRNNVANLRFGSVQITVHEGRVTQVESIEKTRFVSPRDESSNQQQA
ncbi:MAG: YezD family protein [Luteolibacter sp.]